MSSISHAVKGMLTGLDGGLYLVESGLQKNEQPRIQEGIDAAKLMAERIRNAVLDILYYAKERELKLEETQVSSLVHEVFQIVEPKMKNLPIAWACDVEPSLGSIEVDRTALRTALVNLLENAVEACMEDSGKPSHRIGIRARAHGSQVKFEVSDDGIGMDQQTQEQLFSLFFSSKGQKGTGLGLFIAQRVIQQHQGTVSVLSSLGNGTTVSVLIPVRP
jgi:signal transduction histidine kinase